MSARVRVRNDRDGRPVAVKVALDSADQARLVREAAMLTAIRQPGVVGLVRISPGADGLELVTQWVGARSLADLVPLPGVEAAAVVGALAAIVADLHRQGIVHRRIEPRHVLLDRHGKPVLCSFGLASFVSTTHRRHHVPDHDAAGERTVDPDPRPSDDVAALGELLVTATRLPDERDFVPARRLGRRRSDQLHRGLLTIADHARAHDPASRPSAAALAATLAELAPSAAFPLCTQSDPDRDTTDPPAPPPGDAGVDQDLERLRVTATSPGPRRRRLWPFAAIIACVAMVGLAVVWSAVMSVRPAGDASMGRPDARPPLDGATSTSTNTTAHPGFDLPASPPAVELNGRRFSVGAPGDVVSVAPWRCDGVARALLLRPGTGELFLFDAVMPGDVESVTSSFATVSDGTEIVPVDAADGCPIPAILRADGRVIDVALPSGPT